jgi:hypothetical protein
MGHALSQLLSLPFHRPIVRSSISIHKTAIDYLEGFQNRLETTQGVEHPTDPGDVAKDTTIRKSSRSRR